MAEENTEYSFRKFLFDLYKWSGFEQVYGDNMSEN
jgi:hypothetical protein